MDSHDIFRQLTCGVRFSNNKQRKFPFSAAKNSKNDVIKAEPEFVIKKEEEDPGFEDSRSSAEIFQSSDYDSDMKIKEEIKSEDEESESNMNLLDNLEFPAKRKKKSASQADEAKKQNKLQQENINHIRNVHHIHAVGNNPPAPIEKFDELILNHNVPQKMIKNITNCGYKTPTAVQMQALPMMLAGRNVIACAPTGSGKTAAFLLPIIRDLKGPKKEGFRALILCPTRELAKQTQRECLRMTEGLDFRIHIIKNVKQAEMKYGKKSSKKYDILITTPNRVCYLLNMEPPLLDLQKIQWLILDEADKLFETGTNSFRDQFDKIFQACTSANKKVALFSATHTHEMALWAKKNLKGTLTVTIGQRNTATDLVDQQLLFVGSESGKLIAIRDLVRKGLQPPVLVFVQSKDRAQQLFGELLYDGINVDAIHADRTQQQRDNVVRAFREGKIWILICTELMGRGIDFKGVNLVVNYDFPPSTISYIHRIGRTGRAGRRGQAITFFTQNDVANLRGVANIMKNSGCEVPDYMMAMKKVTKRERRKLEKTVPERDAISTVVGFKGKKRGADEKKPADNPESQETSKKVPLKRKAGPPGKNIIKKKFKKAK